MKGKDEISPSMPQRVIKEFFETERKFLENARYARENFEPYLNNPAVTTEDKELIQLYLSQWDTLEQLAHDVYLSGERQDSLPSEEVFLEWVNSPAFLNYVAFQTGMTIWTNKIAQIGDRYQSVLPVNTDGRIGAAATAISPVQRIIRYKMLFAEIQKHVLNEDLTSQYGDLVQALDEQAKRSNALFSVKKKQVSWGEETAVCVQNSQNAIADSSLNTIQQINAYLTMIRLIESGMYGRKSLNSRSNATRQLTDRVVPLIIHELEQTTDPETLPMKVKIAKTLHSLLDDRKIAMDPNARLVFKQNTSRLVAKDFVNRIQAESTDVPTQLTQYLGLIEFFKNGSANVSTQEGINLKSCGLNVADAGDQMLLAKGIAEAALNTAIVWIKEDPHHQLSMIRDSMENISKNVQTKLLDKVGKRFFGGESGETVTIQKQLRRFLKDPHDYIRQLETGSRSPSPTDITKQFKQRLEKKDDDDVVEHSDTFKF